MAHAFRDRGLKLCEAFGKGAIYRAAGDAVLNRPGCFDKSVILIRSGFAYRSCGLPDGRRAILDLLVPGDFAGFNKLGAPRPSEQIHALGNVAFSALGLNDLAELVADNDIALSVIASLARMQSRGDRLAAEIGRLDAAERICVFLLDIYDRLRGRGLIRDPNYYLPITQEQIADHLGLTLVHVNRCLRRLRDQQIVTFNRPAASILDIERVREIADGLPELCVD